MSFTPVRRRLLWGCAAGLACALAAGLFTYSRGRADPRPLPGSARSPESPAAQASISLEANQRAWSPGTWYRYAVVSSQSVTFRSNQPGAQVPPPMRFQLKGDWRVGICSESAQSVEARISFSPSDFSVDMGGEQSLAPEMRRSLREALATPFFVTLDKTGAVRFIHFEHAVDTLVQGLLRSVVAASQVALPSSASASWEFAEEDSSGLYVADYRLKAPLQMEKRKLRYTHLVLDEGLQPVETGFKVEVDAHSTLTLAPEDLWLESLQGEETVTVDPGPNMPLPSTHTQVELRLRERGSDPSLLVAFAAQRASLLSLPMASPQLASARDPRDSYRQALAGRTLSDFITILRALPEEKKSLDNVLDNAQTGLHALFVLVPATAAEVPRVLHTGLSHVAAGPVLGALSAATTPEALHALSQIMGDSRLALEIRADAIAAMSGAEAPTQESISALWKLARGSDASLGQAAILALGSAAMNWQKVDARAADALVGDLSKALTAAQGQEAQELWLGALGNTRSPRALPAIQALVGVPSPKVRSAATQSLRFMPAPQTDDLLSELLRKDDSSEVRGAAVFAASYRPLDPLLPAFERTLRSDPDTIVRTALVELLDSRVGTSLKARALLTWSSEHDPDADIRRAAAKALARPPSP